MGKKPSEGIGRSVVNPYWVLISERCTDMTSGKKHYLKIHASERRSDLHFYLPLLTVGSYEGLMNVAWHEILKSNVKGKYGLPWWNGGKESAYHMGSIPGSGRSPWKGHGNQLQYSCLENPMDRGDWWATVHEIAKSWTWLKQLSMHTHMYTCIHTHIHINTHKYMYKLPIQVNN